MRLKQIGKEIEGMQTKIPKVVDKSNNENEENQNKNEGENNDDNEVLMTQVKKK